MKNVYIRIIVWCLALMPLSVSQVLGQKNETKDEAERREESVVKIIAYLGKNDTLTYVYD